MISLLKKFKNIVDTDSVVDVFFDNKIIIYSNNLRIVLSDIKVDCYPTGAWRFDDLIKGKFRSIDSYEIQLNSTEELLNFKDIELPDFTDKSTDVREFINSLYLSDGDLFATNARYLLHTKVKNLGYDVKLSKSIFNLIKPEKGVKHIQVAKELETIQYKFKMSNCNCLIDADYYDSLKGFDRDISSLKNVYRNHIDDTTGIDFNFTEVNNLKLSARKMTQLLRIENNLLSLFDYESKIVLKQINFTSDKSALFDGAYIKMFSKVFNKAKIVINSLNKYHRNVVFKSDDSELILMCVLE